MLVMDIPDAQVDEVGRRLGQAAGVNLCYQRPRRLPQWPYNLFCMVHGREREQVCQLIERLLADNGLSDVPHQLLFSRSEEHTSELQSLMRISYAVFCLKKKKT